MPPVGQDHKAGFRLLQHKGQPALGKALLILPRCLVQQHIHAAGGAVHLQIAGAGLAGLHQIHQQLFQPFPLPVQHLGIFGDPGIVALFAADQIGVVDNAGKRGFDIVRNIGDQLGLKALAARALAHGGINAARDGVQILGVGF